MRTGRTAPTFGPPSGMCVTGGENGAHLSVLSDRGRGEKLACAESLGDDRRLGAFPNPKCKTQAHVRLQTKPHTTHTRVTTELPTGPKWWENPVTSFCPFHSLHTQKV